MTYGSYFAGPHPSALGAWSDPDDNGMYLAVNVDRPTIKVMADYECFPLWRINCANPNNIDPATLPISPALTEDLLDWAARYDATLNRVDPAASGFTDAAAEHAFSARGEHLARRLAEELGPAYTVEYFDDRTGSTTILR